MKQLSTVLILTLALSLGFSACSKENPGPKEEEITLEGKWTGTAEAKVEYYLDETLVSVLNTKEPVWNYIIFFNPNKAIIDTRYEILDATVSKTNIDVTGSDDLTIDFEYVVSGNEVTVMRSFKEEGAYIEEYNNAKIFRYFVKDE